MCWYEATHGDSFVFRFQIGEVLDMSGRGLRRLEVVKLGFRGLPSLFA